MNNIFISYRRADSIGTAGRIRDRLVKEFGRDRVFVDVDDIPYGGDFEKVLAGKIDACTVLLAIIGPNWLQARSDSGQPRLQQEIDFVGIEIGTALKRDGLTVIPVLVDGAKMPSAQALPDKLRALARRNAIDLRNTQFGSDAERLVAAIRAALPGERKSTVRSAALGLAAVGLLAIGGTLVWPQIAAWMPKPAAVEPTKASADSPGGVAAAIIGLREALSPAEGRIALAIRGGNRVALGNQIVFDVKSTVPGQLILIDVNAAGEVTLIFPNKYLASLAAAQIGADATISVPGPGYGFSGFQAVAPLGKGQLIALVAPTSVPSAVFAQVEAQRTKGFEPVKTPGPYLAQLVEQIRGVLGQNKESGKTLDAWGFAIVEYEIVG